MRLGQVQNQQVVDAVEAIARPAFADLALQIAFCEYRRETHGWVLRLGIEGFGGATIAVDDCSRASRELGVLLDAAGIPELDAAPFALEVTSPGLDRPIAATEDVQRFAGQRVRIKLRDLFEGSRNYVGKLVGLEGGTIRIEREGCVVELPVSNVVRVHLDPEWPETSGRASSHNGRGRARHG